MIVIDCCSYHAFFHHLTRMYSSYPHGGWVVIGLILSTCAALAATMWGVASCRFLIVDYTTDRGDFSDLFGDPTADGNPVPQRVGAGLFSWLVPHDVDGSDWTDGQCAGYTERQREHFGDSIFEAARIFAVFATLSGIGIVLWVMFLACLSLGRLQVWLTSAILGCVTIFVALTFIIFQSTLCTDLVSNQDESYETKCTMDQGGLVVIAAAIFWAVAFLICVMYIKPPEFDLTLKNGRITNAFEERQERRLQREKERQLQRMMSAGERQKLHQPQQQQRPQAALSRPTEEDLASYEDGGTEVQIGHRGRA
jgi:hypothetical protein